MYGLRRLALFLYNFNNSLKVKMPRAKKRFPGESGDAAGQKKKSKGGANAARLATAGADTGMEKIESVCSVSLSSL